MISKKILIVLFPFLLGYCSSFAQQYNFLHYDIEDGLVQSQVNDMGQDLSGRLWIATIGGLSYFNGSDFTNLTKADGLMGSTILSLANLNNGPTYVAGRAGLSLISHHQIHPIKAPENRSPTFHQLNVDEHQTLWGLNGYNLFELKNNQVVHHFITDEREIVSALAVTSSHQLIAYVINKGLFLKKNGKWIKMGDIEEPDHAPVFRLKKVSNRPDELLLLTAKQVYTYAKGKISVLQLTGIDQVTKPYNDVLKDAAGYLWIATTNGAYRLGKSGVVHFTEKEGFTNNPINKLFMDADQQIWFGSDGAGIFKFSGDAFKSFSKITDFDNPVIFRIARDEQGNIYFNSGAQLYTYSDDQIKKVKTPGNIPVNFVYHDLSNHLYIYSTFNGIYELVNGQFKQLKKMTSKDMPYAVFAMLKTEDGRFYFGSGRGCYYFQDNKFKLIDDTEGFTTTLTQIGKDSVLATTRSALYMINGYKKNTTFRIKELENKEVMTMLNQNNYVWFGTLNEGLYLWNKHSHKLQVFTRKNGLSSDDVYSLSFDKNGILWVGTGRGINQFKVSPQRGEIRLLHSLQYPKLIVEANQNAILTTGDTLWAGTAKGLFSYITTPSTNKISAPSVEIKSVRVFTQTNRGQQDSLTLIDRNAQAEITLHANQNKIIINFTGVHLSNPNELYYQYKLSGIDSEYSNPIKLNQVVYSSLPPGAYTFEVFAINGAGVQSAVKTLNIQINPSFYQTVWFKIILLILLVAVIMIAQYVYNRYKINAQKKTEGLRIIEQDKIRVQTAEDFHDDIGNKLTRIAILSDILETKLPDIDAAQKGILDQIKQNVNTLYSGTKDILWALDPQSDNLYEIINYLKEFGIDLLNETAINFEVSGLNEELKKVILPMQYSRNITLMIKELINNALKYAACKNIHIKVSIHNEVIALSVADDGNGFDSTKENRGRGLNNLRARCERIAANLEIKSSKECGTIVTLTFKLRHM